MCCIACVVSYVLFRVCCFACAVSRVCCFARVLFRACAVSRVLFRVLFCVRCIVRKLTCNVGLKACFFIVFVCILGIPINKKITKMKKTYSTVVVLVGGNAAFLRSAVQ